MRKIALTPNVARTIGPGSFVHVVLDFEINSVDVEIHWDKALAMFQRSCTTCHGFVLASLSAFKFTAPRLYLALSSISHIQ
jgi:hypothetical protein